MPSQDRSYLKDFLAGVEPTGTTTFQYGMQDEAAGGASKPRQLTHALGGTLGGAAVVPGVVGGLVGGIKGLSMGRGGLKGRLLSAGRQAFSGAKQPYTNILQGVQGKRALKTLQQGGKLSPSQMQQVDRLAMGKIPVDKLSPQAEEKIRNTVREGLLKASPKHLSEAQRQVGGEVAAGAGALGLSGLISGTSAHQQYAKGQKTQQDISKQKTASYNLGYVSILKQLDIV